MRSDAASAAHRYAGPAPGTIAAIPVEQRDESVLPATLAIGLTLVLYLFVPVGFVVGPGWIPPVVEAAVLVVFNLRYGRRSDGESRGARVTSILLIGLLATLNLLSLGVVVVRVVGGVSNSPVNLFEVAARIWLTNIVVFGLVYWEVDGGGPARYTRAPDFLFPQMANPEIAEKDWQPRFVDYLYVSFVNVIAFSGADVLPLTRRVKLLMTMEALVSFATIGIVVARALSTIRPVRR